MILGALIPSNCGKEQMSVVRLGCLGRLFTPPDYARKADHFIIK